VSVSMHDERDVALNLIPCWDLIAVREDPQASKGGQEEALVGGPFRSPASFTARALERVILIESPSGEQC
jgi:hypothetical protein